MQTESHRAQALAALNVRYIVFPERFVAAPMSG
jgi:hypothetical protein